MIGVRQLNDVRHAILQQQPIFANDSTVGVMCDDADALVVVGLDRDRYFRVVAEEEVATIEDATEFAVASLRALVDAGFAHWSAPVRSVDLMAGLDGDRDTAIDLRACRTQLGNDGFEAFVTFAGRCLSIPEGLSSYEKKLAFDRFLASGTGRVFAQKCLVGQGEVIASVPPAECGPAPKSVAIYERGSWSTVALGGVVGPLGTSQTLRTWHVGENIVTTSACHFRLNSPDGTVPPIGGSVGPDKGHTELLAVAEACERYIGGVVDPGRVTSASAAELDGRALDPRLIVHYADWQFDCFDEIQPYSPDERRLWVDATDEHGAAWFVLADLVFYPFGWAKHRRHTGTSSSGMAAHTSLEKAQTAAVNELIERDAFMRLWLSGGLGRRLKGWESAAPGRLLHAIHSTGWEVEILQIANDRVEPVLLAVGRKDGCLALGASAADPLTAVRKSLSELWATTTRENELEKVPERAIDVSSPSDHTLFALAGHHELPPPFVSTTDGEVELMELREGPSRPPGVLFHHWDHRLSRPFHVVRALCPALIPISFGFGWEPYGRADVQTLLGVDVPDSLAACPPPHPFP